MKFYQTTFVLVLILFSSCANYKQHLSSRVENWSSQTPDNSLAKAHTMYLVGSTGASNPTKAPAMLLLQKNLQAASEKSSVLFLGDQLKEGMPPNSRQKKRAKAEKRLTQQLAMLEGYKGRILFTPGDSDWREYGVKGIKRQEEFIEEYLNKDLENEDDWENYFLPDNACSGPDVIEISEDLAIIVMDSYWWMSDWNAEPRINYGCEARTRAAFQVLLKDMIRKYKSGNIVIVTHHPLFSNGEFGGAYTTKEHLFPLTTLSENFYLPLPVVGSAVQVMRASNGTTNSASNSRFRNLRDNLIRLGAEYGQFIFTAGHDHSMQYHKFENQHVINTGSSVKKSGTRKGDKYRFAYGEEGFAKIDFYKDGSAWLEFIIPDGSDQGKVVFRHFLRGKLQKKIPKKVEYDFSDYESGPDTFNTYLMREKVDVAGKFKRFFLGDHYRWLYAEKFDFPKLDLSTYKGGLTVLKEGGGKATNSLRLESADGHEYVLRSIEKDVTRGIPYPFNTMKFTRYLFSDQFLANHAFGPVVIPPLADAAKVYHANPEVYYLPMQPALKDYNPKFGNRTFLFEERASKSWPDLASFGNANKFVKTYDLALKLQRNYKHKIDQEWVVRSRIFDRLLGDFDRHDDQWRWARMDTPDGKKLYRPIPRDRDAAFARFDGVMMRLSSNFHLFLRQVSDYNDKTGKKKWATFNTRFFDHSFLNELEWEDWMKEVNFIKDQLTDELVEESFRLMPDKAYDLTGKRVVEVFKTRRDKLEVYARELYLQLARRTSVHGTRKAERFEVTRKDAGSTLIEMYELVKSGEKGELLYSRLFKNSETKEVQLYGLGGDDEYYVSGDVPDGVVVRMIGGQGQDTYVDKSKVGGFGKKSKVYDTKKGNKLDLGSEGANKTSKIYQRNSFNRLGNQYDENVLMFIPDVGYNDDNGVKLGPGFKYITNRFGKFPHASEHEFEMNYAFLTKGIEIEYAGVYYQSLGKLDIINNIEWRNNRWSINFFGYGNETLRTRDRDYYRIRQSLRHVNLGLQRRFAHEVGRVHVVGIFDETEVDLVPNTFISNEGRQFIDENRREQAYMGLRVGLSFSNKDFEISPRNGYHLEVLNTVMTGTNNGNDNEFYRVDAAFTIYKSLDPAKRIIFASNVGASHIEGTYDFWYAPNIGFKQSIRGLFGQRYSGNTRFYNLNDIRFNLIGSGDKVFPFNLEAFISFDHGRVWLQSENSQTWHTTYGGGLLIGSLNLFAVVIGHHRSKNNQNWMVRLSHAF